jgi:quercetin dioxygenase-like cupin family protein
MSILKANQAERRRFEGVAFERLVVGSKSMVTRMCYEKGNLVPEHSHPNEQSGYVISGRYRLRCEGLDEILEPGDSYCIPAGASHSIEALESGDVVDVFIPPRADFL